MKACLLQQGVHKGGVLQPSRVRGGDVGRQRLICSRQPQHDLRHAEAAHLHTGGLSRRVLAACGAIGRWDKRVRPTSAAPGLCCKPTSTTLELPSCKEWRGSIALATTR